MNMAQGIAGVALLVVAGLALMAATGCSVGVAGFAVALGAGAVGFLAMLRS